MKCNVLLFPFRMHYARRGVAVVRCFYFQYNIFFSDTDMNGISDDKLVRRTLIYEKYPMSKTIIYSHVRIVYFIITFVIFA